jgi:hypothetical protein
MFVESITSNRPHWANRLSSNTSYMYLWCVWLESWLAHQISWLKVFVLVLILTRWMPGLCLEIGLIASVHIPSNSLFIMHPTIQCCVAGDTDSQFINNFQFEDLEHVFHIASLCWYEFHCFNLQDVLLLTKPNLKETPSGHTAEKTPCPTVGHIVFYAVCHINGK